MTKARTKQKVGVAFWDSSAIVPLCCQQSASTAAADALQVVPNQVVWWITGIEAFSAAQRLRRANELSNENAALFLARLMFLRRHWSEVQPTEEVRVEAERVLRIHSLRTADAMQLAAALVWSSHRPHDHQFIAADGMLSAAASAEGFVTRIIK